MFTALEALSRQKESLQNQQDLGIISLVDATSEQEMIKSREFQIKKQLVDAVHVTDSGKTRAIGNAKPSKSYPEGSVYTKFTGGRTIRAKDIESLYDKLYQIYFGDSQIIDVNSVANVFEKALEEKRLTENPKEGTLKKYRLDYNRFISEKLAKKDICSITGRELQEYSQNLVHSAKKPITDKGFLAYKGVLNLIFGYAIEHDIITKNPVRNIRNAVYVKDCDLSKPKAEDRIFTPEEIQTLIDEVNRRMNYKRWGEYYVYGYAMKFAIETGVRVAELCSLKWDDIDWDSRTIHIHSQQLARHADTTPEYYYAPYTKNERGISANGRFFPLTDSIGDILEELKEKQQRLGIQSEYVFCHEDGSWIKTVKYGQFLRDLCHKFGFKVTRNHGFRMSLNSNVLIQNDISVTDRAALLGHSVETNLKHYSFAHRDYVDKVRKVLNEQKVTSSSEKVTSEQIQIIDFEAKRNPKSLDFTGLSGNFG